MDTSNKLFLPTCSTQHSTTHTLDDIDSKHDPKMPHDTTTASSPADIFNITLDSTADDPYYDSYSDQDEAAFLAATRGRLACAGSARFTEILREAGDELKRKCAHLPKDRRERAFQVFYAQMKGVARMQEEEVEARLTLEKREREELQKAKTISWSLSESGASALGFGVSGSASGSASGAGAGPSGSGSASSSRIQTSHSAAPYAMDDSALEEQRRLWDEFHRNPQSHAQAMPLPPKRDGASSSSAAPIEDSVSDGELTDRPASTKGKGKGKTASSSNCKSRIAFSFPPPNQCFNALPLLVLPYPLNHHPLPFLININHLRRVQLLVQFHLRSSRSFHFQSPEINARLLIRLCFPGFPFAFFTWPSITTTTTKRTTFYWAGSSLLDDDRMGLMF